MNKLISDIVENCDKLKDLVGCDEFKFYYITDKNYCFKFLKKGEIVQVVRRGVRRKWRDKTLLIA